MSDPTKHEILVVDDERAVRDSFVMLLQASGTGEIYNRRIAAMRLRQCNNFFMAYVVRWDNDANTLNAAKLLILSPYRRRSFGAVPPQGNKERGHASNRQSCTRRRSGISIYGSHRPLQPDLYSTHSDRAWGRHRDRQQHSVSRDAFPSRHRR